MLGTPAPPSSGQTAGTQPAGRPAAPRLRGRAPASCRALAWFGLPAGPRDGNRHGAAAPPRQAPHPLSQAPGARAFERQGHWNTSAQFLKNKKKKRSLFSQALFLEIAEMWPEWQGKKPQLGNPAQRAKSKQPKQQAFDSRAGSGRAGDTSGAAAPRARPTDGAGEGGKASEHPRRVPGPAPRNGAELSASARRGGGHTGTPPRSRPAPRHTVPHGPPHPTAGWEPAPKPQPTKIDGRRRRQRDRLFMVSVSRAAEQPGTDQSGGIR